MFNMTAEGATHQDLVMSTPYGAPCLPIQYQTSPASDFEVHTDEDNYKS